MVQVYFHLRYSVFTEPTMNLHKEQTSLRRIKCTKLLTFELAVIVDRKYPRTLLHVNSSWPRLSCLFVPDYITLLSVSTPRPWRPAPLPSMNYDTNCKIPFEQQITSMWWCADVMCTFTFLWRIFCSLLSKSYIHTRFDRSIFCMTGIQ